MLALRINRALLPFLLPLLFAATGCRMMRRPLPPVNLQEPGWIVREGQAVWRTKRGAQEIAGEVLVATRSDGRALVQFSKNPFPLLIGQITPHSWELRVPTQNKRYSGHG